MLLNQAKKMKLEKLEREKEQFLQKNKINLNIKNEVIEKNYSSLSNFKSQKPQNSIYQNEKTVNNDAEINNNKNEGGKNENNNEIQIGTILPAIKSSKNKERIERLKLRNEDDGKIDEINDMMSKIMDEL